MIVLLKTGEAIANLTVKSYQGACFTGQPTAYTNWNNQTVWLKKKADLINTKFQKIDEIWEES